MKDDKLNRVVELGFLFLAIPAILLVNMSIYIKMFLVFIGITYFIVIMKKMGLLKKAQLFDYYRGDFWKSIWLKFGISVLITTIALYFYRPDLLFNVLINKPFLWLFILFIYTIFSVYPQEILYRKFFIERYQQLFSSTALLIFVNAVLFSFAHIIFLNPLVLILTFVGGIIFCYTFLKTKSITVTSIEHSLYGCWLFTLGVGEMLAFPS